MNHNIRKEVVLPLICVAIFLIAVFAGLTTYRLIEGNDCKCPVKMIDFEIGTPSDKDGNPILDDEYTKGSDGYYCLIYDSKTKKVSLAPNDYDRDAHDSFKDRIKETKLGDELEIMSYEATSIVKDNELKETIKVKDLKRKEFNEILENGNTYVFIWTNEDTITKVLLFGETIIYE